MELIVVTEPASEVRLQGVHVNRSVSLEGVDWRRELVVVVDMGEQRSGGYAIQVVKARVVRTGQAELELLVERPAPGGFFTQALTRPWAIARLDRQELGRGEATLLAYDQEGLELARKVVWL